MSWNAHGKPQCLAVSLALICLYASTLLDVQGSTSAVVAWGLSSSGQTNVPPGLSNVISVAGGYSHSLALLADGTVAAWGSSAGTNVPAGLSNVVSVAAGNGSSLALRADGTVVQWGVSPNLPSSLSGVIAIAASSSFSLALKSDGTVVAWGNPTQVPVGLGNVVSVAAGGAFCLALRGDGVVVGWGSTTLPATLTNIVAIAAGDNDGLALRADGTVVGWGTDTLFKPPTNLTGVVAIAAGGSHALALKADGTVTAWGSNIYGQTNVPPGLANVIAIAGGKSHSLVAVGNGAPVLTTAIANHTVVPGSSAQFYAQASGAWPLSYQWQFNGTDIPGATAPLLTITNPQASALGRYAVAVTNSAGGITSRGALLSLVPVVAWGANTSVGYPTNWAGCPPNIAAVSAGQTTALALKTDGTVYGVGGSLYNLSSIPAGLSNVTAIVAGNNYDLVLKADTTVFSWGRAGYTSLPAGLTNVVAIAGSYDHSLALRNNGTVVAWNSQFNVPFGLTNVVTVSAGNAYDLALKGDGTLTGWGSSPALSIPGALSNVVTVSAGYNHALALRQDGTVVGWGDNTYGQTNIPSLSNVVAISAGYYTSLAIQGDGTVAAWGAPNASSVPTGLSNVVAIAAGENSSSSFNLALVGSGPPVLATPLVNRTAFPGGTATFYEQASGAWPLSYQWQFNGTNLPGATTPGLVLTNVQSTAAGAYTLVVTNSQGSVTSSPALLGLVDFAPALNTTNLTWITYGDAWWSIETNVTYDGTAAAQSGSLSTDPYTTARSTLEATVTGPGTLTFWWKISSQANQQFLAFYISGAHENAITGQVDWQSQTYYLGPGTQVLDWVFSTFYIYNTNTAWLDAVSFTPGATAPIFTIQPSSQSQANGADAHFSVGVDGTAPFSYQWQFNGTNLANATASTLTVTNVQAASTGSYSVIVSNMAGVLPSSNAVLVLGKIAGWGNTTIPTEVTNAVAIAAGTLHGLALQPDGTVAAWGYDCCGQTEVPPGLSNVVAIAGGGYFSLALTADGNVAAWGENTYGQTQVPPGLSNVVAIAGGTYHALALQANGNVVAWGATAHGETNIPPQATNVVAIAAGYGSSLALRADGTVVAWGWNLAGQTNVPSGLTNVVAIASGSDHCLALTANGTLVPWGNTAYGLPNVPVGLTNVAALGSGGYHDLVLQANGLVTAWGWNQSGDTSVPAALSNVVAVAAGNYLSLALVGNSGPTLFLPAQNPTWSNGTFNVSVPTHLGRVYQLQYVNSLADSAWTGLPLVLGQGGLQRFSDPTPSAAQRFYRVRQW